MHLYTGMYCGQSIGQAVEGVLFFDISICGVFPSFKGIEYTCQLFRHFITGEITFVVAWEKLCCLICTNIHKSRSFILTIWVDFCFKNLAFLFRN